MANYTFNREKAKAAGHSDKEINDFLAQNPQQLNVPDQTPTDPEATVRNKWADWLPLAGAIGGSFIPGLGTVVGGGVGAALGAALKQPIQGKKTDVGEILKEGAYGTLGGVVGKGVGYVGGKILGGVAGKVVGEGAGKAIAEGTGKAVAEGAGKEIGMLPKIGGTVENLGSRVRSGVAKIYTKAGIGGAAEEKTIASTLQKLGIKGTAQSQYEMLQPAMKGLEGKLTSVISKAENPVLTSDIKTTFKTLLKPSMLSKDMTSSQAVTEINGFLNDLNKMSGRSGNFAKVDAQTLLDWKRLINASYGTVEKKLAVGTPLTPRENVINVAWKAIDESLSKNYPEAKALLTQQSHLYKASQSLASARKTVPTTRFMGTTIPQDIAQGGQDLIGRGLQNVGSKIGGINLPNIQPALNALPKIGAGVATLPSGNAGMDSVNNTGYDENGIINSQNTQQEQDNTHITNYITGYSPEQLFQAAMKAQLNGDKSSYSTLKGWYDVESAYQKNQTGGSNLLAKDKALVTNGLHALDIVKSLYAKDPSVLTKQLVPGKYFSREFDSAVYNMADTILRLRTGAQANPSEIKAYGKSIAPSFGDSAQVVKFKLNQLETIFNDYLTGGGQPETGTLPPIE